MAHAVPKADMDGFNRFVSDYLLAFYLLAPYWLLTMIGLLSK